MPFVVPGQQQPQPQQQREGRGGGMERRDYASQQPGPAYRPPQQQQSRGGGYEPWQQQRQQSYRQPQRQQPRGGYQQMPQPQQYRGGGRGYQQPQYQPPQQPQMPRGGGSLGGQPQYQQPQYQPPQQGGYSPREMSTNYARQQQEMYSNRPMQGEYQESAPIQQRGSFPRVGPNFGANVMGMSNRPQQGTYVGEGVYADGTPMPTRSNMANFQDGGRRFAPATFPGQAPTPSSGFNGQSLVQSNGGPAGGVYSNFSQTPEVNGGVTPAAYLEEDDVYNKSQRGDRGGRSGY